MKVHVEKEDLEKLDRLKPSPGYKVLVKLREEIAQALLVRSAGVKTRMIQTGNVTYTETADSQIQNIAGILEGVDTVIGLITSAKRRLDESNNTTE